MTGYATTVDEHGCDPTTGRLMCDNCGSTFPYTYRNEISLPAHRCFEIRANRIAMEK